MNPMPDASIWLIQFVKARGETFLVLCEVASGATLVRCGQRLFTGGVKIIDTQAMRNNDGETIKNAHLLGFFRRICRLLFHRVRPVFVFDGASWQYIIRSIMCMNCGCRSPEPLAAREKMIGGPAEEQARSLFLLPRASRPLRHREKST